MDMSMAMPSVGWMGPWRALAATMLAPPGAAGVRHRRALARCVVVHHEPGECKPVVAGIDYLRWTTTYLGASNGTANRFKPYVVYSF
jgi:hypothetical protein